MFRVQTYNKISPTGVNLFSREDYEVASELSSPDAIVVRSAKLHDIEFPQSLKAIARAGAGVNNIPVERCSEKGIVVFNTPGANANSVKELVIAGMLLSSRKLVEGVTWSRSLASKGAEASQLVEQNKSSFAGPEIKGKKLGVIGLGAIGVMVANDAVALGMDVLGYDPFISVEAAWGLSPKIKRAPSLDALIAECDYITVHVPFNDKTRGMINADKIAMMKNDVRLLNFSRSGIVDNAAVLSALEEGAMGFYVTDFPDEHLVANEKVIPIPHLGASTPEAEDNCAVMAVNQLKDYLTQGIIKNSVNYPDCDMPFAAKTRITVANRNIPNMVGQITTTLAKESVNIVDMLNKSRGEFAYTIIDTDSEIDDSTLDSIRGIEGVISVRKLKR